MEKSIFETTQDFFDIWLKTYEATYGRLLEMPALGPARERAETMMKSLSTSVNLYTVWLESVINFQTVFVEAMRRVREKITTEELGPEEYRDFYKVWMETYSETFKEFLKSGHFSSDMGRFMSYFIEFQKINREMLEENYLKPLDLPTRAEIDELNKEVYYLKKAVKGLNSQIKSGEKK